MLKAEDTMIKFCEVSDIQAQRMIQAFKGSNTEPKAILQTGIAKLENQEVKFDNLQHKRAHNEDLFEKVLATVEGVDVPAGACHWNHKVSDSHLFVKCREGWATFGKL